MDLQLFYCDSCENSFLDLTCLYHHINTEHRSNGQRVQKCPYCIFRCCEKSTAIDHLLHFHSNDVLEQKLMQESCGLACLFNLPTYVSFQTMQIHAKKLIETGVIDAEGDWDPEICADEHVQQLQTSREEAHTEAQDVDPQTEERLNPGAPQFPITTVILDTSV
ncbi:hypothetical protein HGRIS_001406 [Hohenbuehelia grisea]|uniref:C2H2-type domain-containing protein n=1 Tax=Hohenbuehelia grisea TaxID=104357 RepID=A0ABR3JPT9_9AGAR